MIIRRPIVQIKGLRQELDALANTISQTNTNLTQALADAQTSLNQTIAANKTAIEQTVAALDAATLKKAANLSDVTDAAAARTNISVPSIAEVTAAIDAAKLALGTNHTVATIAERDALVGLDENDRVTVIDAVSGDWTTYGISDVVDGVPTFYVMTSKTEWETANSAAAVKVAYESNPDTNAFTDAEQTKVGFISVTSAIDLDKVVQNDELLGAAALLAGTGTASQIPSAEAVQTFVAEAVRTGGTRYMTESRVVAGDSIVLSFAPKDGMVLNFATVRFIDVDDTAADIQVSVDGTDATGKTFTLAGDSAGQFDGKQVTIQYPYVEPAAV